MTLRVFTILMTLICALHGSCWAREAKRIFYVDAAKGDDGNAGTSQEKALKTIGKAAKMLQGGDQLIVLPGVYYERPAFFDLKSSKENPIWILAQPRGEATISAAWKEAALGKVKWKDEGDGVYSTPKKGPALFGWTEEKLFLPRIMKVEHLRAGEIRKKGWKKGIKVPPYGHAHADKKLFVKLPGAKNPNGVPLMFSLPSWGEWPAKPVVRIGSPHVIFDGFRVQGSGTYGIIISGAHGTVRHRRCRHDQRRVYPWLGL